MSNEIFPRRLYRSGAGTRGVGVESLTIPVAKSDQDAAFVAFYDAEVDRQVRRAVLLLGSNDVANDVVHDAFVAVFRRWAELDEPGPYLHRSVLNGCRAVHRSRSRLRTKARQLARVDAPSNDVVDPLDDVLNTLPFNQRAAIVLRFYFGMTNGQIADELGCAPGSVGPWINRALSKMRKALT